VCRIGRDGSGRSISGDGTSTVSNVAKARGIAKIAKDSGLGRESLYKALAPGAKPRFETVQKLVDALGVRWTVAPPTTTSRRRAHA
jgi:probable addiction module antidote protein